MAEPYSSEAGIGGSYNEVSGSISLEYKRQDYNIYDELKRNGMREGDITKSLDGIISGAGNLAELALTNIVGSGVVPGLSGLREARGITTGEIISERMELAFKGINCVITKRKPMIKNNGIKLPAINLRINFMFV